MLLALACGVAVLGAAPARAKTISITIAQKTELRGTTLASTVTIGNTGDEAAKSVAPTLRFADKQARGKMRPELQPNTTFDEELTLEAGQLGEGRWPFQVSVDYADANQYPFQALLVTTLVQGNPPPAKVSVPEIASSGIAESGTLKIRFKNLSATERDSSYRIAVPEGLEASQPTGTVHLAAWAEATESVSVVNRTALAGSRYPVFVSIEYDDGGVHQGVVAQGIVDIVAPSDFWQRNQMTLFIGAGILVVLWLGLVVRRATSRAT